ncbi:MAG TPA: VWA domain-containing protein [Pyrinomonadaceae bacterium]|jgi:VWFA-related protein
MTKRALPRLAHLALALCLYAPAARAQQPTQDAPPDEPVRVSTELVQTDVVVFDKQGQFVDNLRADDFELRVDGHPQAVAFFERVRAGSVSEEAQLAAARGGRSGGTNAALVRPLDRGRLIYFFIDDLHMSPASMTQARELLLHFFAEQMGQNDLAAVITASGQVGFLQQLTDDRAVLRAAVARLTYREVSVRDNSSPPMSPQDALNIERNDSAVVSAYVDATLRDMVSLSRAGAQQLAAARAMADAQVRGRARQLLQQVSAVSVQTLGSLQQVLRDSAQLPGRKLIYFISDGFVLNTSGGEMLERIRRVTDAAVRSGAVVYTLDARGLSAVLASVPGASQARIDPTGRLSSSAGGEAAAMQEPLRVIAGETGGRALLNTNALTDAVKRALDETSVYYLLAWRPEGEARGGKFRRVEVSVKQRPELTVLLQRGFFAQPPPDEQPREKRPDKNDQKRADAADGSTPAGMKAPHPLLLAALKSFAPRLALPTALTLNYLGTPKGDPLLASSLQVVVEPPAGGASKHVDVIGAVYDEQGKVLASFERHLTISPDKQQNEARTTPAVINTPALAPAATPEPQRVGMTHQTRVAPGLYQVRVAAREVETGRTGSATQWLTVPQLNGGALALSSIFLGERSPADGTANGQPAPGQSQILINPERRFTPTSVLRFILYTYNAARDPKGGAPDVAMQLQILRDDQPVITSPLRRVVTDGLSDFQIIPYAAELDLTGLPAGRYILQAAAIDRTAKTSAIQRVKFTIE